MCVSVYKPHFSGLLGFASQHLGYMTCSPAPVKNLSIITVRVGPFMKHGLECVLLSRPVQATSGPAESSLRASASVSLQTSRIILLGTLITLTPSRS